MVREAHVEIGGRQVRYLEAGAGWPLLLLHGFPLSADMWRPQLEEAPEGWRLIAPDLRGFGASEPSSQQPTMEDLAGDVRGLLNALEIDRAVMGGVSMGGYVTFALFRLAPDRFSGMVLADTRSQADTPEGRQARRALSELLRTRGPSAVADQMIPKLLGEATRKERPEVEREVRRMTEANSVAGLDGAIHAMLTRPDSTPLLKSIACPVLVVVGEEDVITPPADSQAMHRALGRSHLVQLRGVGHLSSLEAPADFSETLGNFLLSNL